METQVEKYLKEIYYAPKSPGSFSSLHKLWAYIKTRGDKPSILTKAKVKEWLVYQDTASVYTPARVRFPRERIIVSARDQAWDADLADLGSLKQYNDGVTFILVLIDLLSRFCWLRPLQSKKGREVRDAIANVFETDGRVPQRMRTDRGRELDNKLVRELLTDNDVHYYTTFSETKANYAERVIKTIKSRLFKYMYDRQTYRYIDVLQDIASSYNNTVHTSIGMPPAEVTESNDLDLYMRVYMPYVNKIARQTPKYSFNVGDTVRIAYGKEKFSRSYNEQFSEELFTVRFRIPSIPPRYLLEDSLGENIEGSFYEKELKYVPPDDDREFKIDEVIKYRKVKGRAREALIKWYGYSPKFNSWIPASQVKQYESSHKAREKRRGK